MNRINSFKTELLKNGMTMKAVPVEQLYSLEKEMDNNCFNGGIHKQFYQSFLKECFSFNAFKNKDIKSIIIIACPSPLIKIIVPFNNKDKTFNIPPGFCDFFQTPIDKKIQLIINNIFNNEDKVIPLNDFPRKILAAHSGLGKYGKNNLIFTPEFGSYLRLAVIGTSALCDKIKWKELEVTDNCNTCSNCLKKCPTKAIRYEHFIINAEKCLSYHNEFEDPFSEWIKKEWHNCIIDCMRCQSVCPNNSKNKDNIKYIKDFTEEDFKLIIKSTPYEMISEELKNKLKKYNLDSYYNCLSRNIKCLL